MVFIRKKVKNNVFFQKMITENINEVICINSKYQELGYKIYLNNDFFEIIYKNVKYIIKIVYLDTDYYWELKPYNQSVFRTHVKNNIQTLDLVLFAISDDQAIHQTNESNKS